MIHQFWRGGQVPVGVANIGMAEEGRENRQFAFHVFTSAMPVDQGLDGETVTKIMNPRTIAIPLLP
ncbi:hypothetical protein M728_005473 (plasmid) [Ensifer sp. WSM1721]|nr:hypothetical protein [Ensifer sp. WSM1721]